MGVKERIGQIIEESNETQENWHIIQILTGVGLGFAMGAFLQRIWEKYRDEIIIKRYPPEEPMSEEMIPLN